MGKPGKRCVQVLRLLETFRLEDVHAAARQAGWGRSATTP